MSKSLLTSLVLHSLLLLGLFSPRPPAQQLNTLPFEVTFTETVKNQLLFTTYHKYLKTHPSDFRDQKQSKTRKFEGDLAAAQKHQAGADQLGSDRVNLSSRNDDIKLIFTKLDAINYAGKFRGQVVANKRHIQKQQNHTISSVKLSQRLNINSMENTNGR
jgi:hypothetical protein